MKKTMKNAYYAAFMIDREQYRSGKLTVRNVPNMINEVIKTDFEIMRVKCIET